MRLYVIAIFLAGLAVASALDITLKPARRHDTISRRSTQLFLAEKVELTYAEDVGADVGERIFRSHLGLQTDQPILLLEDFDHLFEDVRCDGLQMMITMHSNHVVEKARTTCQSLKGGLLISSHFSCSEDDQHSFYQVHDINFNDNTSSIILKLELHQHDRLFKRQATSTSGGGIATTTAPSEATGTHTTTIDLGFTNTSSSFLDFIDLPIDFGCRYCSATGELILSAVDLTLNDLTDTSDDDLIETGSLQFDLKGFDLSIGLRAIPSDSAHEVISLFKSPRLGFNSGLFSAGVQLKFEINLEVEASGGIELGFGFDVAVPDSTLHFDIAEINQSSMSGINHGVITPQLLSSNVSNVNVSLIADLQVAINFGMTLGIFDVGAGPKIDLPRFNMTVKQLATKDVGANCESNGDTDTKFKDAFQNLTHVEYVVGIAAGFEGDVGPYHLQTDYPVLEVPVATQCLVWQSEGTATRLAPATAVLAAITAPPSISGATGGNGNGKSAAVALSNPLSRIMSVVGVSVKGFLVAVCAVGSVAMIM